MQNSNSVAAAESVVQRVYLAVRALATGRGDVRNRLRIAGATLSPLRIDEFPEDIRSDFAWVMKQLTQYDAVGNEGRIEVTLRRIQNSTGEKIAVRMFDIFSQLQNIRGRSLL